MRQYEIKGYVRQPQGNQVRFTTTVNALDRSSATQLAKNIYSAKGDGSDVNISFIRDAGKSDLKQN